MKRNLLISFWKTFNNATNGKKPFKCDVQIPGPKNN